MVNNCQVHSFISLKLLVHSIYIVFPEILLSLSIEITIKVATLGY